MDLLVSTVGVIPALISISVLTLTVLVAQPKNLAKLKGLLYTIRINIEDCILFLITATWIILLGVPYGVLMTYRFSVYLYLKVRYGSLGDLVTGSDVVGVMDNDTSRQILKSVKVMEGECDLEELRVRAELSVARTDRNGYLVYPKFHQYLSTCGGFFCWKPSKFDMEHHIRYLPGLDENSPSMSEADCMEACGRVTNESFPPGRANWEILVIPRFHYNAESESVETAVRKMAIFIRIHHGIGDGFSLLKFIAKDMARQKEYDLSLPKKPKRSWLFGVGVMFFFLFRGPRYLYWEMGHKDDNALHSKETTCTGEKCLAWSEQISVEFLKKLKTKLKSGMSTIMLSAFAGSLRQYYHEIDNGKNPKNVTLVMPLPAPNHPDDQMVNKFSIILFPLSMDSEDPMERAKDIDRQGRLLAQSPELVMNIFLVTLAGAMPIVLARPFFTNTQATVVVSNIPGPNKPIKIYNRKLVDTMFWLPHLGSSGISISFLSYGNDLRMGLTVDKGIIPTGNEGSHKILDGTLKELLKLAEKLGIPTEGVIHDPHASFPYRQRFGADTPSTPGNNKPTQGNPSLEGGNNNTNQQQEGPHRDGNNPGNDNPSDSSAPEHASGDSPKNPSDVQEAVMNGHKEFQRIASRQ